MRPAYALAVVSLLGAAGDATSAEGRAKPDERSEQDVRAEAVRFREVVLRGDPHALVAMLRSGLGCVDSRWSQAELRADVRARGGSGLLSIVFDGEQMRKNTRSIHPVYSMREFFLAAGDAEMHFDWDGAGSVQVRWTSAKLGTVSDSPTITLSRIKGMWRIVMIGDNC